MELFKILLSVAAILTSGACLALLLRGYRRRKIPLLMWSAVCFTGLTLSNIALFCDLVVFPDIDLRGVRLITALTGMAFLLYGFIWNSD
jgi:hypothetical protein